LPAGSSTSGHSAARKVKLLMGFGVFGSGDAVKKTASFF
jgi:hypothetical protein